MVERQIEIFEELKSPLNNKIKSNISLPEHTVTITKEESVSPVSYSANQLEKLLQRLFSHSKQ